MMLRQQLGMRMLRGEHLVQQRLCGIRQHQAGDAVDGHQHQPADEQTLARRHQRPDLRPELLQVWASAWASPPGRARAAPCGRALGAQLPIPIPAAHGAHALHLSRRGVRR